MTSAQKHPPRGKRHGGRRRALELLYALEFNGLPFARGETEYLGGSARRRKGWSDFAHRLASGAFERRAELDAEISGKLRAWKIERLALIDRLLLRLALTELREEAEIPLKVTLNEYIELAKVFGTEESPEFINGILDKLAVAYRAKDETAAKDEEGKDEGGKDEG